MYVPSTRVVGWWWAERYQIVWDTPRVLFTHPSQTRRGRKVAVRLRSALGTSVTGNAQMGCSGSGKQQHPPQSSC